MVDSAAHANFACSKKHYDGAASEIRKFLVSRKLGCSCGRDRLLVFTTSGDLQQLASFSGPALISLPDAVPGAASGRDPFVAKGADHVAPHQYVRRHPQADAAGEPPRPVMEGATCETKDFSHAKRAAGASTGDELCGERHQRDGGETGSGENHSSVVQKKGASEQEKGSASGNPLQPFQQCERDHAQKRRLVSEAVHG